MVYTLRGATIRLISARRVTRREAEDYDLKSLKVKRRGVLPGLEEQDARAAKVRVTIALDLDVVEPFKAEAKKPGALPYQTQINRALRRRL